MANASHTGPWRIENGVLLSGIFNFEECPGLAHAAPEMLEALILALDEIHHPGAARSCGQDIDAIIRAAIAKATGGQP